MSNARARIHKAAKSQYAAIPNAIAQSRTLSPNARAVLVELLSRPDDWEARADQLAYKHLSIRTVYRVLAELIDAGYVVRTAIKGEDGRWKYWRYDVFDAPVEPVAKNDEVVESKKADTAKRKSETMRAKTHFAVDGTHTKTEKEERETNAPTAEDGIPDHIPPHLRPAAQGKEQQHAAPDGNATAHQIAERYCDAWDIIVERYRKAVRTDQKRYAEALAAMGATPDDVFAMCQAKRKQGKQPDEYGLRLVQLDWPGWKSRTESTPQLTVINPAAERAAQEAALEAERVAWWKEQGLS